MRQVGLMLVAGLCLVALGSGRAMVGVARCPPGERAAFPGRQRRRAVT